MTPTTANATTLWDTYKVSIVVDRIVGGIPANEKLMKAWLDARADRMKPVAGAGSAMVPPGTPQTPDEAAADLALQASRLDPEDTHAVVFYRDAKEQPCYEGRCFKAAIKESGNILKDILGVKALRSKISERVFVEERFVPIKSAIQRDERPISVMTMQGPRTSIKRFEFAEDVKMEFTLKVLTDGVIKREMLETIFMHIEKNGLGSDRSQGNGGCIIKMR